MKTRYYFIHDLARDVSMKDIGAATDLRRDLGLQYEGVHWPDMVVVFDLYYSFDRELTAGELEMLYLKPVDSLPPDCI